MRRVLLVALLLSAAGGSAAAQTADQLVASGVRSYNDLEFTAAADFLEQALAGPAEVLASPVRDRARAYLGASLIFLDRADSAAAVFRSLLLDNPRYRLDQLVFPPRVSAVFDRVRRDTHAIAFGVAPDTTLSGPGGRYPVTVHATAFHRITAEVLTADGAPVTPLYSGPVVDSLELQWDLTAASGTPVPTGAYRVAVRSEGEGGVPGRRIDLPLQVTVLRDEPLPEPPPPSAEELLPERRPAAPAVRALAAGLVAGAAVALLPSAVAGEVELSPARFGAAAGIGIATIVGFVQQRPGAPLPENVVANEARRAAWRARAEAIRAENARRRTDVRVRIRPGPARLAEPGPA